MAYSLLPIYATTYPATPLYQIAAALLLVPLILIELSFPLPGGLASQVSFLGGICLPIENFFLGFLLKQLEGPL